MFDSGSRVHMMVVVLHHVLGDFSSSGFVTGMHAGVSWESVTWITNCLAQCALLWRAFFGQVVLFNVTIAMTEKGALHTLPLCWDLGIVELEGGVQRMECFYLKATVFAADPQLRRIIRRAHRATGVLDNENI